MKRIGFSVCFIVALALAIPAQSSKKPIFSAYPTRIETAKAKVINFRQSPDARTFKTRLKEALRGGVNFAGHYIVAGWGCGTGCISGAIIDARNGNVYWLEQFNALGVGDVNGEYAEEPVAYRKNSRLLVITGSPGRAKDDDPDLPSGEYYYEWKANRLRLIKYIAKRSN